MPQNPNQNKNLPQKHFGTKFPHTEIKHELLSNTLNSSIYIANHFTEDFLSKEFVFVDLFAGRGAFNDGTKGSPIIALETIYAYMKKAANRNFEKFTLIFIEKDKENYKSLIDNISQKFKKETENCKVEIIIASDDWESYSTVVEKDFIINLGLPRTSKGKLENADRFYLCLLTNSVGISDTFLKTYAQILNTKENQNPEKPFDLASKIMRRKTIMTLLEITSRLYSDFYSWKNATEKEIPTSSNLTRVINFLIESGKLKLQTTEFTRKFKPNKLLAVAFSSKIKQGKVIVEWVLKK